MKYDSAVCLYPWTYISTDISIDISIDISMYISMDIAMDIDTQQNHTSREFCACIFYEVITRFCARQVTTRLERGFCYNAVITRICYNEVITRL